MSRLSRSRVASWLGALFVLQGCSHTPQVEVPARIQLSRWSTLGIVEFRSAAEPELASLATSQFVQMLHAAQPGTPILELGSAQPVLAEVGHDALDFEAVRAIGERYGVDAIFTGELVFDAPKPRVSVGDAFDSVAARADVTGRLAVRLLDTRTGASVWSDSSSATASVAHFGMAEGAGPVFGVSDPSDARLDLVQALVQQQRFDFYPSWQDR
jgi:hypothetical protein